ncbi:hypothetical protein ECG_04982 [Echinococcus granulosus]|nr:hypothetical protein ECG_04982 [Echinococcus granulosus]
MSSCPPVPPSLPPSIQIPNPTNRLRYQHRLRRIVNTFNVQTLAWAEKPPTFKRLPMRVFTHLSPHRSHGMQEGYRWTVLLPCCVSMDQCAEMKAVCPLDECRVDPLDPQGPTDAVDCHASCDTRHLFRFE